MSSFTRNVILETFKTRLQETPFDKITVSSITKTAGIGHNTFYYYFDDIYALLDEFLRQEIEERTLQWNEDNWQEGIKELLHYCKDNARLVYHLFNCLSRDRLERYIFTASDDAVLRYVCSKAEGHGLSQERITDISNFCRYTIVGYLLRFLWNNMNDDIDSAVDRIGEMLVEYVGDAISKASAPET